MATEFNKEAFSLLGVGLSIIGLRTYTRIKAVGLRRLALDDYLMLFAAVIYGLETGAAYSVGARYHGLANNSMTTEERATLSPQSEEYSLRVGGSKLQLMGWSSYTLLLWTLKTCVCTYYLRMTAGVSRMKIRVNIGFGLILATYIATITSILAGCGIPFSRNWQINPDPGNHCQPAISKIDLFVTLILNVLTDAYLLSIPIPLLWKSQISRKEKACLLFLFSGAVFVMMAGILRCVLILLAGANGAEQAGSWAVRETFVAVVVANMPIIYSLLRGALKSLSQYSITISKRSATSTSGHVRMSDMTGPSDRGRHMARRPRNAASRSASPEDSIDRIIRDEHFKDSQRQASDKKMYAVDHIDSTAPQNDGGELDTPGITVATRTTVQSEAASQLSVEHNHYNNGQYQCRVSIDRDCYL